MFTNHTYLLHTYEQDLALNNLHWLMCHKTKPTSESVEVVDRDIKSEIT